MTSPEGACESDLLWSDLADDYPRDQSYCPACGYREGHAVTCEADPEPPRAASRASRWCDQSHPGSSAKWPLTCTLPLGHKGRHAVTWPAARADSGG